MDYDIVFLGGGPAGYEGGIAASKRGLKTAVIEKKKIGGTCLHRGCIPTKTLLHSAKLLKQIKTSSKLGIKIPDYQIDIQELTKYKNRVVSKLVRGIEHLFNQYDVDLVKGEGKIISPEKVVVNGEQELTTKYIVVSTGTKCAELPFLKFDNHHIINSDSALELVDIPDRLLVIGAGAVGLELGTIYHYLGSEVTIVEIMDQVLPGADRELSEVLQNELLRQNINIFVSTSVSKPIINNSSVELEFSQGEKAWKENFSKVLVSVGREPLTTNIYHPSMNIRRDKKGFIIVNANLQTDIKNIFACGDVVGSPLLAHKASHQAISIVDFILEKKEILPCTVPTAVFTLPEIASVGLTEEEAKRRGIKIKVGRFPYAAGSRSNIIDDKRGMVKVIADNQNLIIGAHIIGSEAGELMPILTRAVAGKMNANDFKELIFIHPTLGENIWEAIGIVGGFSIHI